MSISDISEFAAWEAEHRPFDQELDSEREQQLREMHETIEGEMAWQGQDSSNDERSQDSEEIHNEPEEELPSNNYLEMSSTEEKIRGKKTDVVARRMIGHHLGINIPLKTDEQRAFAKALREKRMRHRDGLKEDGVEVELPSSTAQTLSQTEELVIEHEQLELDGDEEEERPDFSAPPSSQPRPSSSPDEIDGDNDTGVSEQEEDPLEEFDVDPEAKEFLLELFKEGIPTEEMELLSSLTNLAADESPRLKAYFENAEQMHSNVAGFARSHPFWENQLGGELEMQEYTQDVYDYSRATGMGKNQAKVEVMRAKAAWRKEKGVDDGNMLEETDEEVDLGIRRANIHEKEAKDLLQQTPKKFTDVEDEMMKEVSVVDLNEGQESKKRKWAASNLPGLAEARRAVEAVVDFDDMRLAKRRRKELKKERRKKQKAERKMSGVTGQTVVPHTGSTGPANQTQSYQAEQLASNTGDPVPQLSKSKWKRMKKKAKQGPITSAYFSKNETLASSGDSTGVLATIAHAIDEPKDFLEGPSTKKRKHKNTEAILKTTEVKAEPEHLQLEAAVPLHKTLVSTSDVCNHSEHQDIDQETKRKRKRKRNHNQISGDQTSLALEADTIDVGRVSINLEESATLPAENENLQGHGQVIQIENSPSAGQVMVEDSGSKMKKKKSKHDRGKKGDNSEVAAESQNAPDPLPDQDGASIPMLSPKDRGKKSKRKHGPDAAETHPEIVPSEALSELADTNPQEPKTRRRDRERKRKTEDTAMELDIERSEEDPKALHS